MLRRHRLNSSLTGSPQIALLAAWSHTSLVGNSRRGVSGSGDLLEDFFVGDLVGLIDDRGSCGVQVNPHGGNPRQIAKRFLNPRDAPGATHFFDLKARRACFAATKKPLKQFWSFHNLEWFRIALRFTCPPVSMTRSAASPFPDRPNPNRPYDMIFIPERNA